MEEKVFRIVGSVMAVPQDTITLDSSPDNIESWDSLKHMNLVLALEQEFGVSFDEEQISQMLNVALIMEVLKEITNN